MFFQLLLLTQSKEHSAKSQIQTQFCNRKCSSEHSKKRSGGRTSQQQGYECYQGALDNKQGHRKTNEIDSRDN